jgi:histidinol-phosphate aminotransferase
MGCGSIDVCLQAVLATVDPGGEVLTGWPTFNAYPLLVDLAGGITRTIGLRDGRFDLPAMAGRVHEGTRLVILCNPNNPTGTAISHDDMAAFLGRIPPDLLVVVDEAYREFADGSALPDSLALAEEHHNLLLLRTFSKAHGLAGLRVGYGIASAGVIGALRKVHVPFAVSRMAQRAALASLQVEEELRARVREVVAERERLAAALTGMGFAVPPSQANFVLVPVPGAAEQLADACERCGVIVRPLGADLVRVTVGTPAENDRLLATLPDAWSRTRPVTE